MRAARCSHLGCFFCWQVNFLITQFLALALAPLFRGRLHPKRVGAAARHGVALALGLFFGYFCFGA